MMELNDFKARIKSSSLPGAYLFVGEEEYLKRYYLKELIKATVTDEVFALMNHSVFEGPEVTTAAVSEAIDAPPMMSDYKMVEWKYASVGTGRGKVSIEALCELAAQAKTNSYTVLAILLADGEVDIGDVKRPSKTIKALEKEFEVLRFDKSTEAQLLSWLKRHFDAKKIAVSRSPLEEMIKRVGHSMDSLSFEVDKLVAYASASQKSELTVEDVRLVCSSNVESDTFELTNAISERNIKKAFNALSDMKNRRVDPIAIINTLASYWSDITSVAFLLEDGLNSSEIEAITKLHPYRVKNYISYVKKVGIKHITASSRKLSDMDAAAKSGGIGGYSAIEMFITEYI